MTSTPTPARSGRRQPVPIERIVELWADPPTGRGMTLSQVGAVLGLTRQRISQRLIEAGYQPNARYVERLTATLAEQEQARQRRSVVEQEHLERRSAACEKLQVIATELGVSPLTLGQYAVTTGTYGQLKGHKDGRYGTGKLPPRSTPAGDAVASRVVEACAPWGPQHIGRLCYRTL